MSESNGAKKELNESVLRKLEFKIFQLEQSNHNTKKLTDTEMVQKIRKTIDEMVRAEDNL